MIILDKPVSRIQLMHIEEHTYFEYDSLINPPRNREAGYPRAGRTVADPLVREKIKEVTDKWILK